MAQELKPKEVSPGVWEIEPVGAMKVPVRIFASRRIVNELMEAEAVRQAINVAQLPGIVGASMAMPDIHQGYGFPIGGVAGFSTEDGVISPGGVGYDINCGVRLIATDLEIKDVSRKVEKLVTELGNTVPAGLGSSDAIWKLKKKELAKVLIEGAAWAVEQGFGEEDDLNFIESRGRMEGADPDAVSDRAYERGKPQVGTLGSGNHFLEIQVVEKIFDPHIAEVFGLFEGQMVLMLHTGSRGFGYQVCDDYIKRMRKSAPRYGIKLPDSQLISVPFSSAEGRAYFSAMKCAANFAWANRQVITGLVEEALSKVMGSNRRGIGFRVVWDLAHNIAKEEVHSAEGRKVRLVVHRKGATRAFAAGSPDLPERYVDVGQPVLVPGDMGRASYVCVAKPKAMELSWGSAAHGAGRVLSRHAAIRAAKGRNIVDELASRGVKVHAKSKRTVAEEMPEAYKDVSEVVHSLELAGLAGKVAVLKPRAVVKG